MTDAILTVALWFCAMGTGLMAGVYFTFSTFVMTSLARIPRSAGVAAMQSINSTILRSLFMPLFFGTTLASLALTGVAIVRRGEPGSAALLVGGSSYVVGMFLCTVIFNVPLNNELDAADPESDETAGIWSRYLRVWTLWNHVRTVASGVACGVYIAAIAAAG
jgi:uncharacterized membrane protein